MLEAQQFFALGHAFFGQRRGAMFFVERVIDVQNQLRNDFVDAVILVGGFFGRAGNDQRRARFVDQDRVDFVDDGEVVAALHALGQVVLHVVAQVVETEFVVGAEGDVRGVGGAALHVVQVVHDHADGQAQHFIDRAHPLRVAACEVIVHGDDVDAQAGERIQIRGKGGDERFSFAGFHFGDFALMQDGCRRSAARRNGACPACGGPTSRTSAKAGISAGSVASRRRCL